MLVYVEWKYTYIKNIKKNSQQLYNGYYAIMKFGEMLKYLKV